eukprot:GHVN01084977.1.p2 GENE.GHVN01084977.1~~GHVN01084977.1.p2  ORF type:complete len:131 (+),score=9.59 GHVN01084977.1:436-828(+)
MVCCREEGSLQYNMVRSLCEARLLCTPCCGRLDSAFLCYRTDSLHVESPVSLWSGHHSFVLGGEYVGLDLSSRHRVSLFDGCTSQRFGRQLNRWVGGELFLCDSAPADSHSLLFAFIGPASAPGVPRLVL